MYGVFTECKDDIDVELQKLPKGITKSKRINYRTFSKVISMYFAIKFKSLIKGDRVSLLNRFGFLNVVKTNCIRYNPYRFSTFTDENGNFKCKKIKIKLNMGYWYFVFWDAPKRFRQYRFHINIKYKHLYMDLVNGGQDYLDYSLDSYGKSASSDYIHHIK